MSYVKTSVGYRRRSKRSRGRKRRVFASVVIVAAATLAAWFWNEGRGSAVGHRAVARTPAKTIASPAWTDSEFATLRAAMRGAFSPALAGAKGWSLVILAPDGATLYGDRSERAVAPASSQKLIVAASALDALGPEYRYHTIFAASQTPSDGTIDGDLWLAGSGDPSLQAADLRNGIAMLARSGVRRISGGIVVDATAMKGPQFNPYWNADDDGQAYAAPISAISIDGDAMATPMHDVPSYVAAQTQAMLRARGIELRASPRLGRAPLDSVLLWDHESAPLRALEAHMLFLSDNHYAEQLLRTIGDEANATPDDRGGEAAERRFLDRLGIPARGLHLYDGSGLSGDDRVAAITLARLLVAEESSLYMLLPLGGRQGTLAGYDFTTALGRVRAKSGHLSDVSSLAGYAATTHHGRVAFAFLIDGSPGDPDAAIVRAIDRLVEF